MVGWDTVFTFMLVYFIFASRYVEQHQEDLMQNRTVFWSLPVVYYARGRDQACPWRRRSKLGALAHLLHVGRRRAWGGIDSPRVLLEI